MTMGINSFLLDILKCLILFSPCLCLTDGGRGGLCEYCPRPMPTAPVMEDIYHLGHNDPCTGTEDPRYYSHGRDREVEMRAPHASNLCKALVQLYLDSELHYGGRGSKCPGAVAVGCANSKSELFDVSLYQCTISLPGRFVARWKPLSWCVKQDYDWFVARTRTYGANHAVVETPRAPPQIQRPRRDLPQNLSEGSSATVEDDRGERGRPRRRSSTSATRRAKSSSPSRPLLCDFVKK